MPHGRANFGVHPQEKNKRHKIDQFQNSNQYQTFAALQQLYQIRSFKKNSSRITKVSQTHKRMPSVLRFGPKNERNKN
jgi:hypothetical protein